MLSADFERQAPHGGRRIELLRHRHKGRIVVLGKVEGCCLLVLGVVWPRIQRQP
jgi:hypothetical protein